MDFISVVRGLIGIAVILGISWLLSNNKRSINWKMVGGGLTLQLVLAILILKGTELGNFFAPLGWVKLAFTFISSFFVAVLQFTSEGAQFIFGDLAKSPGVDGSLGFFFAFQVLPTIIFFASLTAILYHLGIMQKVVQGMAWVMAKVLGTSGAESLSCTANIFVGQTEAPLLIKPYIDKMTKSELYTVMVGGMATIAGGVMAAYIQILGKAYSETHGVPLQEGQLLFATQLLGASVMAAPAALIISKIIFPEKEEPVTKGEVKVNVEKTNSNVVEAAASGATDGLWLSLNVGGMLIAFIALIYMFNSLLYNLGDFTGLNSYLQETYKQPLNFQLILGYILQPLAFAIGVPWDQALNFGSLLGTKIVLNEFVAFIDLGNMVENGIMDQPKVIFMASYALCGFANFSSIAIQLGGIGGMAPDRKSDLAQLGLKAVIGGSLATLLTAAWAGLFFAV
ncbi:MAG: NupC/NupG family nucleoside CNT transporter [Ignavibacteriaceae bacterium]|nr:NupC/NupG family nucleoside CNT transporter [Ignavibacteriaceae bacterium]